MDQIGPQFELGQYDQIRANSPYGGRDSPTEIERTIKYGSFGILATGQVMSCLGRRGDDQLPVGMSCAQSGDDRFKQIHLANAYRVKPDRWAVGKNMRHAAQESLSESFAVLAVPEG